MKIFTLHISAYHGASIVVDALTQLSRLNGPPSGHEPAPVIGQPSAHSTGVTDESFKWANQHELPLSTIHAATNQSLNKRPMPGP